jgi:hypothetical protein
LGEPHLATLDLDIEGAKTFSGTTGSGERFTPKVNEGKLVIELGAAPKYVTLGE